MMKHAVKMKQAIRTILPRPILNRYVDFMDRLRLEQVPQKSFDAGNLRSVASLDLSRFFFDPEIVAAWEEDHAKIASLFYPDKELFFGVNPGDRRAIYFLIMALKPRNVLEIGTHIGASTISIAAALRRLNEGRKLTTVDIVDVNHPEHGPWRTCMSKSPANCARELGLLDQIHFHTGPSQEFMRGTAQRFDFVFLDGDHGGRTVYEELSAALPLLHKGGVILLHDYYLAAKPLFPNGVIISGPFHAMVRIYKENAVIEVLPLGVLPWPTKLGTNVTSLALVVKRLTEIS
ncbi:MAG: class I SAM-dependent methyltransferase [Pseudomonadota bacterium]|nr:class I SAM-dependent methyltransferase [Pseudomonadota bacterium]